MINARLFTFTNAEKTAIKHPKLKSVFAVENGCVTFPIMEKNGAVKNKRFGCRAAQRFTRLPNGELQEIPCDAANIHFITDCVVATLVQKLNIVE